MKKIAALVALLVVVGLSVPSATGSTKRAGPLAEVASQFAQRPVQVVCGNLHTDPMLIGAWGYVWTPTGQAKKMHLDSRLCGALYSLYSHNSAYTDWWRAQAALVLVHEAFHMRRIPTNQDEAMTECRALQNADHVLRAFGATDEEMKRLIPLMVLAHYRLAAMAPEYNRGRRCLTPIRYDEWLSYPWHQRDDT